MAAKLAVLSCILTGRDAAALFRNLHGTPPSKDHRCGSIPSIGAVDDAASPCPTHCAGFPMDISDGEGPMGPSPDGNELSSMQLSEGSLERSMDNQQIATDQELCDQHIIEADLATSPPAHRMEQPASEQPGREGGSFDAVQANAIKLAVENELSINLLGKAGAGKSHTTREIVRQLREKHGPQAVRNCSYMWATACADGEGCVSLNSLLNQGLFDKNLSYYTNPRSGVFKKLCEIVWGIKALVLVELPCYPPQMLNKAECVFREVTHRILTLRGLCEGGEG